MKAKTLIILGLCVAVPMVAFADKKKKAEPAAPVQEPVEEENNVITEECLTNVSLFHESAKNKQ